MDAIGKYSGIGRALDPRYPTNLAILILSALAGAGGTVWQFASGAGLLASVGWGFVAGFAVFMGWGLSRELDPDHPRSAFIAPFLAFAGVVAYGLPGLLLSVWMMITLRVLNRTTGVPAKLLDQPAVLLFSLWLSYQGIWLAGLAAAAVFALDAVLPRPNRQGWVFATLSALGTLLLVLLRPGLEGTALDLGTLVVGGAAGLLFVLVILNSRDLSSTCDAAGSPLYPSRVRWAQGIGLAVAVLAVAFHGRAGLLDSLPLWAALLGTGLYRLGLLAFDRGRAAAA